MTPRKKDLLEELDAAEKVIARLVVERDEAIAAGSKKVVLVTPVNEAPLANPLDAAASYLSEFLANNDIGPKAIRAIRAITDFREERDRRGL